MDEFCSWGQQPLTVGPGQNSTLSVLPDRQFAMLPGIVQRSMQELLQQIDIDYFRAARLLIVHAELERLRQERPALADAKSRGSQRTDNESGDVGTIPGRAARAAE